MKPSLKLIPALLLCAAACVYTACKKNAVKPALKTTTNIKSISAQIALNLYASITGKYGGNNITNGIKAPSSLTHRGPVIFDTNPLCGFFVDTVYNTTTPGVDTTKAFSGEFKFTYTCSAASVDGFIVYDSLKNVANGAAFKDTLQVVQNYTSKALDQTYRLISMNGYLKSYLRNVVPGTPAQYHLLVSTYILAGLHVDVSSGTADITVGTATFNTTIGDLNATTPAGGTTTNYTGTITFLGGHMASLSITVGGVTTMYSVNLLTGVIS